MDYFYFDASALAKQYADEQGIYQDKYFGNHGG